MANCQYGCEVLKGEVRCQCPSPGLQLAADGRTCVGESALLFLRPPGLDDEQANGKKKTKTLTVIRAMKMDQGDEGEKLRRGRQCGSQC